MGSIPKGRCGQCRKWLATAERDLNKLNRNGYKPTLEDVAPYCPLANNHMPYDAEPECGKPPYRA